MMSNCMIRPTTDGFLWEIEGAGKGTVSWHNIEFVEVFKRDCLTTDEVCMNVKLKAGGWLLLTEEIVGFTELVKSMNARWNLGNDWYSNVVLPPFETRKVVITPCDSNRGGGATAEMVWK